MRDLTCATCGQPIPYGHVARYTGVDIEHIQAHHVRCGRARRPWGLRREVSKAVRNVTHYALARIGLTF
jgi:hypothetical protein